MRLFVQALQEIAKDTVCRCCFQKKTQYLGKSKNTLVFLPAGDEKYKSFWLIDTIFSARSGLLDTQLLGDVIDIIFTHGQNGSETRYLKNGLQVPPYAIADHINFDGNPVFFPGTYAAGEDQGNGSYGYYPPLNNLYLVTELVSRYLSQGGDAGILEKEYHGCSLRECLKNAFYAGYALDPQTQLCQGEDDRYTVDWTYCDQVKKSGLFLVPSVMRAEAAGILADFLPEEATTFRSIRDLILKNLIEYLFNEESGWFYSATGKCRQKDVWGTAYAVYSGLLPETVMQKACQALKRAYIDGSATCRGYVRQILTSEDASDTATWQHCDSPHNSYMNGGYWATPSGWFAYGLYLVSPELAAQFTQEYITFTQEKSPDGAPYEWFHPATGHRSGRYYGTSGTSMYAAVKKLSLE